MPYAVKIAKEWGITISSAAHRGKKGDFSFKSAGYLFKDDFGSDPERRVRQQT